MNIRSHKIIVCTDREAFAAYKAGFWLDMDSEVEWLWLCSLQFSFVLVSERYLNVSQGFKS